MFVSWKLREKIAVLIFLFGMSGYLILGTALAEKAEDIGNKRRAYYEELGIEVYDATTPPTESEK